MMYASLTLLALFALSGAAPNVEDGKIVGGHDVNIEDFAHQLSFEDKISGLFCGASIIDENWALTAAHCVEGIWFNFMKRLRAGSSTRGDGGFTTGIDSIHTHPDFSSKTMDYDFALIKVSDKFPLGTAGIQKIGLTTTAPAADSDVCVSGWGALNSGGISLPHNLQAVCVKIIDHDHCQSLYSGVLTDRMICAGVEEGGKDSCQGDSGGPLINKETGVQVGVVSWGQGCASSRYPGVYSNVAAAKSWIDEMIKKN